MRIGVFPVMAGRNAGGPESYEIGLLRALALIDQDNEYFIYCTGEYARKAIGVEQENFVYRILSPSNRLISIGYTLPRVLKRDGVAFHHSLFTPPPSWPGELVYTVHCLSSILHPELYHRATAMRLNFLLKRGIQKARMLTCVSETTRQHVIEMFGTSPEQAVVTYNGTDPSYVPMPADEAAEIVRVQTGIEGPYILYVGKIQPHKNVQRLVRAYAALRQRTGTDAKLVLVGREQGSETGVAAAIEELGLQKWVVRLGYVDHACLRPLYSAARVFAFPSLYEGFGIPIIEAMACGTPVVTSKATCLPEIAGDAALVADCTSVEELAGALERLDSDAALRSEYRARGLQRAQQFTWTACAERTKSVYQQWRN